ncbi:MAG: bifunctional demethylmenaquinone methyltransferase/2-methoxy-6-polyprenyl-1,4-benzoquinol methylase UbiE [Deltaproteobacteria bacterium HGW-Deltaproteobacteria-14]|jgi:demethylmenaquinone methyltransferase/2-methoxy-6-polyprenyl-1,4-benzoquinol methylase|nr:MAG: bifunctional demethylmenaquinone methyltransferase/2-methoxy-6-polyprenyl-1,4-benzoquinol methylase UbiE [Deltaproteobacteria bacterium HGW-Deltaproteobacteria-14]
MTEVNAEPGEALGSGAMFDRIAARYDRLNGLMSMGFHRLWRRRLVAALGPLGEGDRVLDLASGTADVAVAVARAHPEVAVVGVDPSEGMLAVGRHKVARAGLEGRVRLEVGDAQALALGDDSVAASCIAFGIRNVPDRLAGLREMARVTRPGGPVVVLELSWPRGGVMSPLARMHVRHVLPRLGAWLSGEREYRYLADSVAAFPPPDAFGALMREAGLDAVTWRPMTLRTAHLYVGRAR